MCGLLFSKQSPTSAGEATNPASDAHVIINVITIVVSHQSERL